MIRQEMEALEKEHPKIIQKFFGYGSMYMNFNLIQTGHPNIVRALESLTGISERLIRHQGEDVFAAGMMACGAQVIGFNYAADHAEKHPEKEPGFLVKHYRHTATAFTFAFLGGVEACESISRKKPFDTNDMIAYGIGLTVFRYGVPALVKAMKQIGDMLFDPTPKCKLPSPPKNDSRFK